MGDLYDYDDDLASYIDHNISFGSAGAGTMGLQAKGQQNAAPPSVGSRLYEVIDKDHSGTITREEWNAAFETMAARGHGVISRKEWTLMGGENYVFDAICGKSQYAVIGRTDWRKAFGLMDKDNSGTITPAEWLSTTGTSATLLMTQAYGTVVGKKAGSKMQPKSQQAKLAAAKHQQQLYSPRAPGNTQDVDNFRMLREDKGSEREKLRRLAETIQRQEKAMKERTARQQRAQWAFDTRAAEIKAQLKRATTSVNDLEARYRELEVTLENNQKEEKQTTAKAENMEQNLKNLKKKNKAMSDLQAQLDAAEEKAARSQMRLSATMRVVQKRGKPDVPEVKPAEVAGQGTAGQAAAPSEEAPPAASAPPAETAAATVEPPAALQEEDSDDDEAF